MYRNLLKHIRRFAAAAASVLAALFLGACGGKEPEPVDTQLGVDGYVYMPTRLSIPRIQHLLLAGDYVYYFKNSAIYRAPAAAGDSGSTEMEPDFSAEECLFKSSASSAPSKIEMYPEETDIRVYNDMRSRILDSGKALYAFYLTKYYTVDSELNLYYYIQAELGDGNPGDDFSAFSSEMEHAGGMLYKQTPDGQIAYSRYFPPISGLAVDNSGRAYVLTEDGIFILDEGGNQTGTVSIDEYKTEFQHSYDPGTILPGSREHIYYVSPTRNMSNSVLEVDASASQLKKIPALSNLHSYAFSASADGKLLINKMFDNAVYEYDPLSQNTRMVMRWEDSNLSGKEVRYILSLSPERLLAVEDLLNENTYLLTKTSVDQLPKKEIVVIASLDPQDELRDAVISFNRSSSQYHVIIETYGDTMSDYADRESRLDATLVSSTPPDLFDIHNIRKYAGRGALEDLAPLLAGSSQIPLDDYLPNVIDGYTIDGRLVCIPTQFTIFAIAGRASQLEAMGLEKTWTMKDVYALTEKYPGSTLLHTLNTSGAEERSTVLERFCSHYFLDAFVDWDAGKCSFDSDGFRQMLTWLDGAAGEHIDLPPDPATGYPRTDAVFMPKTALLALNSFNDFEVDLVNMEYRFREEIRLMGMPAADGSCSALIIPRDCLGITSNARSKEGALAFLEYYLSKSKTGSSILSSVYFSTRLSQLEESFSSAVTPPPKNDKGHYITGGLTWTYGGVEGDKYYEYYFTPQRLAEQLKDLILSADFSPLPENAEQIRDIVLEEAENYFKGDKTLDETVDIIQNRAQLLLNETRP